MLEKKTGGGGEGGTTYLMEILVLQATAPLGDFQPRVVHYHLYLHMSPLRSFTGTWIHFTLLVATVSSALMAFFLFFFLDKSFIVS